VTRGERDQVSESFEGHGVAVAHGFPDRVFQWENLRQGFLIVS